MRNMGSTHDDRAAERKAFDARKTARRRRWIARGVAIALGIVAVSAAGWAIFLYGGALIVCHVVGCGK